MAHTLWRVFLSTLKKSTSYLSLCRSLNSFWDETSRTWTPVGPETRYWVFWLGLSPSTWVQDSIWGKWFQLPSMDYPLLQLISCDKKISSICAFRECVSSKQEEPGQLQADDLKLWHYISFCDHMPREERSQGMKRLRTLIPMSHLSDTVSIWGSGHKESSCNLEATSSLFWGPKSLAAARSQTFK